MTFPDDNPSMWPELEHRGVGPVVDPPMTAAEGRAEMANWAPIAPVDPCDWCGSLWGARLCGCDEARGAAAEDHAQDTADAERKGER